MAKITFDDKTNQQAVTDREKQVTAEDLNEIKSVVNENDDALNNEINRAKAAEQNLQTDTQELKNKTQGLDETGALVSDLNVNGKNLKNVADPVDDQDGANKRWTLMQTSGNGSPKGVAYLTTNPIASPVAGDWYWTAENGDYTNFGVTGATAGGRLIYDGSNWVFVVSNEPYLPFPETDPATVTAPASGYFVGTWDGRIWIMGVDGKAKYQSLLSDFESQSQANGIEAKFRDDVLADGGTYYPNTGAAEIAKLVREDLYKKVSLILTAAAAKAGTGIGDGVLYTIKGSNFAVYRNCKASRVDQDGYIKFVNLDEIRIDYSDGKAKILLEDQSTNKILFPFAAENNYWTKTGLNVELDPSTAGAELNPNPNFVADASDWKYVAGTSTGDFTWQSDGNVHLSVTTAGTESNRPVIYNSSDIYNGVIGKAYKVTINITINSGTVLMKTPNYAGGGDSNVRQLQSGDNTFYVQKGAATYGLYLYFDGRNLFDVTIHSVSVKEVQGFASPFKDTAGNVLLKARKLVEDTSTGNHYITRSHTVTDGSDYAKTRIVKANERTKVKLISADGDYSKFDIDAGTKTDVSATGKIKELADGYYAISIVNTITGTTDWSRLMLLDASGNDSYTGDGVSGIYLAGTQFKEGNPTSFINNPEDLEGSEVTRLADAIQAQDPTIADVETGNFSVFADIKFNSLTNGYIIRTDASSNSLFTLWLISDRLVFQLYDRTTVKTVESDTLTELREYKVVGIRNGDVIKLYVDGVKVGETSLGGLEYNIDSTTSYKLMSNLTSLFVDGVLISHQFINGALTDEEAINLTK